MATVTFTCRDQSAALLAGVAVVVTTARGGIAACGVSSASGVFTATLTSGAYTASFRKTGVVTPKDLVLQVASSDVPIAVACVTASAAGAASVDTCRVFGTVVGARGRPCATAVHVEVAPTALVPGGGESVRPQNTGVLHTTYTLQSDTQGYWEVDGVVGVRMQVWIPESGFRRHFIVPNVDSVNVADVRSCKEQEVVWT